MRAIQYEQKLSLAVERLVDGITIEQLWRLYESDPVRTEAGPGGGAPGGRDHHWRVV